MNTTPPDHPAASSLPPSDGGGADWKKPERLLREAVECAQCIQRNIDVDLGGIPPGDIWLTTIHAHAHVIETNLQMLATRPAPTQQPAEQPEAGEPYFVDLSLMHERCYELACEVWAGKEKPEDTRSRAGGLIGTLDMHGPAYAKARGMEWKPRLATPRPESPDAQRGELDKYSKDGVLIRVVAWLDYYFARDGRAGPEPESVYSLYHDAKAALPAKGPGPRSDTERLDWVESRVGRIEALTPHAPSLLWKWFIFEKRKDPSLSTNSLRSAIDAAMDSPPASHSKQREQQT